VSHVAKVPAVRALLLVQQRDWVAERGGAVVEGRDIGTVVFPDAPVKVYLTADPVVRAARRHADEAAAARTTTVERVRDELLARDRIDSGRATAPLERAADALDLDTTALSVDDAVARVLAAWTAATGEDT
jgi:CMP/dCMP kinase